MIKNLIYGALGVGGVAMAATAFVLATASSEPPKKCMVTLDANGGTFTLLETDVYSTGVSYSNKFGSVFNEETVVTNYNYDLKGWTNALGVVSNDMPVLSDMTCYAKWERSAIQKFNLVNGKFSGTKEGANYVAQFPAAFYGTATIVETNGHVITFIAPQTKSCRISFDPQIGGQRICVKIKVIHGDEAKTFAFGEMVTDRSHMPFAFNDYEYEFTEGEEYTIELDFSVGTSAWSGIQAKYVFGIDLGGHHVKFDAGEYGSVYYNGYYKYDKSFRETGANVSTNLPFGHLPSTRAVNDSISFDGWYSAKKGGTKVETTTLVGTNDIYYAHWKLPTYYYYVAFSNNNVAAQGRKMPKQKFTSGVAQALSVNRYYLAQHKFLGWDTDPAAKNVVYTDGQTVTDIWDIPEGTCPLYAVWEKTPGENYFTVSQGVTNFVDVAISNLTTFVNGTASTPAFMLAVTNSATLRVSLDPKAGTDRAGAKLTIYKQFGSNWSNVCEVTDMATTNTMYSFEANTTYRFNVTGASASYAYVVGLGAKGAQIGYDSCGVQDMSFNWTVDTPYGYWPTLTSAKYGKHLGWFYDKDITHTNEVKKTESVVSNATIYAHWANQPYYIKFDGSGATSPSPYVQDFYYGKAQALSRNQFYKDQSRFLGWTNESGTTNVVYKDYQVVSNLCTIAGGTNKLYAVWQYTPGTNWYYVAGGMTNFGTIAVSQGKPTLFVGKGDMTQFMVTETNIAKCRVALDPQEGFARTGATLSIDCAEIPTNKTEKLAWENACTVSDLSDKEVKCAFTTNHYYRFTVAGVANTNGYVVSIGTEGAQYIFDVCGGNFVGEKETTKVKFYNWTVGSPIGYTPPVTTNAYVHGSNTWHYTPQLLTEEAKLFNVTNIVVSGGEKVYAHWSDAVIVELVFNWNLATCGMATNIVFTNYYGQGSDVYLYKDEYVRQPTYDNLGFLGWTTNATGIAGWDIDEEMRPVTTNSPSYFYAQWTDAWKTSRTSDGKGLSIDGYYKEFGSTLEIPKQVKTVGGIEWPVPVVAIGDSAFENCQFSMLSLPDTLTRIGDSAFCGCSAFSILNVPAGVAYVGSSAFEDCTSLTAATFEEADMPDEYTKIGDGGFLDGIVEDGTPSVELCECLFKGCTSLKDVKLPLGVNCIPDECFSGCAALTSFDKMPYTVMEIGAAAFYGCTHLTNIVHTEIVDAIGSGAFKKCARLKFASFIGDNPEAVESDILKGTPRNVLVRYLENMCETANDYCGGNWPALPGLWPVAGDTDSSRTLTWLGGKYPRRKVIFNYNDNEVLWQSTQVPVLYHKDRVFGLLAPTEEEMNGGNSAKASNDDEEGEEEEEEEKTGFSGWYTQPVGGRKVGDYWVVPAASEGDSAPITVYAHWGKEDGEGAETGSRSGEDYPVLWPESFDELDAFSGFYTTENDETGGDDIFYYSACTFNGIVIDENNMITGTVAFVFQDGTYPEDGGMQSAFTATVTWNTGKTTTLSGVADAEGYLVAKGGKWSLGKEDDEHRTVVTKSGLNGWLTNGDGEFRIYAARNRTAQATEGAARTVVLTGLQATKGTWHVVLGSDAGESAFTDGYSTMAITIANMGQATVEGTLADGTKVSQTSTLIIGDGCCCLPVSIKSGKGGFAFMLWFTWQSDGSFSEEEDDVSVKGLTSWTLSDGTAVEFSEVMPLTFIDEKRYSDDAYFGCDLLTTTVRITAYDQGTKWKIAEGEENPDKLKVSYNPSTGLFTGSFAVEVDGKKSTATVNGAFTDRITAEGDEYHGYGTAVVKGVGSAKVEITTVD